MRPSPSPSDSPVSSYVSRIEILMTRSRFKLSDLSQALEVDDSQRFSAVIREIDRIIDENDVFQVVQADVALRNEIKQELTLKSLAEYRYKAFQLGIAGRGADVMVDDTEVLKVLGLTASQPLSVLLDLVHSQEGIRSKNTLRSRVVTGLRGLYALRLMTFLPESS